MQTMSRRSRTYDQILELEQGENVPPDSGNDGWRVNPSRRSAPNGEIDREGGVRCICLVVICIHRRVVKPRGSKYRVDACTEVILLEKA